MADKHPQYRPDIDGLRAIAVISVIAFHIDKSLLPGGFVGVDIFFVISGYLITTLLLQPLGSSLPRFYRNRIRRIVPVLSVVIVSTLVFAYLTMLPRDLVRLSESAIWSQWFAGNIFFTYYLDTSYFAPDSAQQPLLHLWSLGVEEQFYLLWPLLLLMIYRGKKLAPVIAFAWFSAVASVLFGEFYYSTNHLFTYYMLPARALAILAGALCALYSARGYLIDQRHTATASNLGAMLIVGSLVLINEDSEFPGFSALPVTVGTAALILAGRRHNPISRLLSKPILVWIGLLSYSLYLWHWPVIAFAKYLDPVLSNISKLFLIAIIVALSCLSYYFIELPFRKTNRGFLFVALLYLIVPGLIITGASCFLIYTKGYGTLDGSSEYIQKLRATAKHRTLSLRETHVCQEALITEKELSRESCVIGGSPPGDLLLWGDSNAAHFVGALTGLSDELGFSFRNIAHTACPPVLSNPQLFTHRTARNMCETSNRRIRTLLDQYDTVILSGNWQVYLSRAGEDFQKALADTLRELSAQGKRVLVIGSIPELEHYDRNCARKAIKVPLMDCEAQALTSRQPSSDINIIIRRISEENGALFTDFNNALCTDDVCSGYINATPIYFDKIHLSYQGSLKLGERVRDDPNQRNVLRDLLR